MNMTSVNKNDFRSSEYNIRSYGARGIEHGDDTIAIQTAIDTCHEAGGGRVCIPPGEYCSGPLKLRSHVDFHLEAGAVIRVIGDPVAYGYPAELAEKLPPGTDLSKIPKIYDFVGGHAVFLSAEKERNISITGQGTIWGTGEENFSGMDPRRGKLDPIPQFRIALIQFKECIDVRMSEITIRFGDSWTLHFLKCDRIWVDRVAILQNMNRLHADGIDIDCSRNVHISNCHITAGDDCIAFKTTEREPCENVVVNNCTLETPFQGIKIGTESHGNFRNIHVSNCVLNNCGSGIGFFIKDGGTAEFITLSNISYTERENNPVRYKHTPIIMDIGRRHLDSRVGSIRHVTIQGFYGRSRTGALIQGLKERPIENLTLRDIHLIVEHPMDFSDRIMPVGGVTTGSDERAILYVRKPSYFTIAHVRSILIDSLQVCIEPEVFRESPRKALWLEHVDGGKVCSVMRNMEEANDDVVMLEESSGIHLSVDE